MTILNLIAKNLRVSDRSISPSNQVSFCNDLTLTIWILTIITFLFTTHFVFNNYNNYVHVDQKVFSWSHHTKSLILSAFFWGYLIMNLPAAMIGRRYNNQMLLAISMTLTVALCLITPTMVVSFGWPVLVFIRFLQGITQVRSWFTTYTIQFHWIILAWYEYTP